MLRCQSLDHRLSSEAVDVCWREVGVYGELSEVGLQSDGESNDRPTLPCRAL